MHDDRKRKFFGQDQLLPENITLNIPRRVVIVIIHTNLPNRSDFLRGMNELPKSLPAHRSPLFAFMRMHANRTKYVIVLFRNLNSPFALINRITNTDHSLDSGSLCIRENRIEIILELWGGEMAMTINHAYILQ